MVDSREPKALDEQLRTVGFDVYRQTLLTGDLLWTSTQQQSVCVERKTAGDLLGSLVGKQANGHGRLQNQMERMRTTYDIPILLIEGHLQPGRDGFTEAGSLGTKWYWDSLDNMLLSLQRGGIIIARCARGRVPERIVTLKNYFDKSRHRFLSDELPGDKVVEVPPEMDERTQAA